MFYFVCVQHQKRLEAEQLLLIDEESLKKHMNAKRAREEAEKNHKVCVLCMCVRAWVRACVRRWGRGETIALFSPTEDSSRSDA
jgi:hypothetical protein